MKLADLVERPLIGLAALLFLLTSAYCSGLDNAQKAERINVGIIFTKAGGNENLQHKFKLCIFSILKYATVNINLHIIGDRESQKLARRIISRVRQPNIDYKVNTVARLRVRVLSKAYLTILCMVPRSFRSTPTCLPRKCTNWSPKCKATSRTAHRLTTEILSSFSRLDSSKCSTPLSTE